MTIRRRRRGSAARSRLSRIGGANDNQFSQGAHMGLAAAARGELSINIERKGKANENHSKGALAHNWNSKLYFSNN
jgi:hypothetical protein